jgi:microcystin-dependent protein
VATTTLRGNIVPSNDFGNNGDLYYKSNLSGPAGLYAKIADTWIPLTGVTPEPETEEEPPSVPIVLPGGGVPVGTVITWVGSASPDSTMWAECTGQAVARVGSYETLFSVLGTAYGTGDGSTTFNLPDFRGHFLMGLPAGRSLGIAYGAQDNQINLAINQLPQHNHSGTSLQTVPNGDHTHSTDGTGNPNFREGLILRSSLSSSSTGGSLTFQTASTGVTLGIGSTNVRGGHGHTIVGNTGDTGSGSAITIEPRNYGVRYFIKYA